MNIPSYFQEMPHAISITVIGCGGTGSVLLQNLARIHVALIGKGKKGLIVTCVDHDIVTESNLGRQLFPKEDIGRPKCVSLIERINRFYGTCWHAIPQKFDVSITDHYCFPGNIIITCVDNVETRKQVYNYFSSVVRDIFREEINNYFWIDTGNTFDSGQVFIQNYSPTLPNIFDIFPKVVKVRKKKEQPSCSLAEALGKQDLFINTFIAMVTSSIVWNIFHKRYLDYRGAFVNLNKLNPIKYISSPIPMEKNEKFNRQQKRHHR